MSAHPNLITVSASAVTLAGVGVVAYHRVKYWRKWGADLYDHLHDSMLDRFDVDIDLDGLTQP